MKSLRKRWFIILLNIILFQTIAMANTPIRNMLSIGSALNVISKKPYAAPKLTALLNETNIAGSNQTNVAEGTGGGFLAASS